MLLLPISAETFCFRVNILVVAGREGRERERGGERRDLRISVIVWGAELVGGCCCCCWEDWGAVEEVVERGCMDGEEE